jgi:hypothetical protein
MHQTSSGDGFACLFIAWQTLDASAAEPVGDPPITNSPCDRSCWGWRRLAGLSCGDDSDNGDKKVRDASQFARGRLNTVPRTKTCHPSAWRACNQLGPTSLDVNLFAVTPCAGLPGRAWAGQSRSTGCIKATHLSGDQRNVSPRQAGHDHASPGPLQEHLCTVHAIQCIERSDPYTH